MQPYSTGPCRLWVGFPGAVASYPKPPPAPADMTVNPAANSTMTSAPYNSLSGGSPGSSGGVPSGLVGGGSFTSIADVTTDIEPLGTCERGADIMELTSYEDWMSDRGGTKHSDDLLFEGKEAVVTGVLTRYRERIYRRLAEAIEHPFPAQFGIRRENPWDIGALMIRQRKALTLFVEFLYGGGGPIGVNTGTTKPVHAAGSMPNGYRYPAAIWLGPTRHRTGTGPKKIQFVFRCHRVLDPVTGRYTSADEDLTAIQNRVWEVSP